MPYLLAPKTVVEVLQADGHISLKVAEELFLVLFPDGIHYVLVMEDGLFTVVVIIDVGVKEDINMFVQSVNDILYMRHVGDGIQVGVKLSIVEIKILRYVDFLQRDVDHFLKTGKMVCVGLTHGFGYGQLLDGQARRVNVF